MIDQKTTTLNGRQFSYLDFGGPGRPLLALHGTFGRASCFGPLAQRLAPDHRLIALDQRGHGLSEHGGTFTRDDFVGDAAAFIDQLGIGPVPVLGHSLGGVNAFQLAARHPELVSALALEDVPVVTDETELAHPVVDATGWPRTAPTRQDLASAFVELGMPSIGYFLESAVERDGAWRLCFDVDDMMATQWGNVGNWWDDWLASRQPALLLRGTQSMLLSAELAAAMAARRPGTALVGFPGCGHWIHRDDPAGYALAISDFLARHRAGS